MITKIASTHSSYYFPNAVIIITECGCRHARPKTIYYLNLTVGDEFDCPYDHEEVEKQDDNQKV